MKTINFRTINANEIDLRVGSTNATGFSLLLYKDARVDADILDSTVGQTNWQCKYYQVKNTMVCSVGININYDDETKDPLWIWKDDGGDDDYQTEKVKAELSDGFKRACFRWSIGRKELYNAPFIWIKTTEENTKTSHYSVKELEYSKDKVIVKLVIINDKTKQVVFSYGSRAKTEKAQSQERSEILPNDEVPLRDRDIAIINTYVDSIQNKKGFMDWVKNATSYTTLEDLFTDEEQTHRIAESIRKSGK